MKSVKLSYAVRIFQDNEFDSKDYLEALDIYAQSTGPTCKTDTRQISHWAAKYDGMFDDKLLIFCLYLNNKVVGFAMGFYFMDEKTLVMDHFAIDKKHRGKSSFLQFVDLIKMNLTDLKFEIDYTIIEVVDVNYSDPMLFDPYSFIRLLKWIDFRVAKIKYKIPSSDYRTPSVSTDGVLMVHTKNSAKKIPAQTLFSLLNMVLNKLYLRWYSPFMGKRLGEYEDHLLDISDGYKKVCKPNSDIVLNGYHKSSRLLDEVSEKDSNETANIQFMWLSFLAIVLFSLGLLLLPTYTSVNPKLVIPIFSLVTICFVIMCLIWFPNMRPLAAEIKNILSSFLTKKSD